MKKLLALALSIFLLIGGLTSCSDENDIANEPEAAAPNWETQKYSITYDANGGSGTMDASKQIDYGSSIFLKKNKFSRSNHVFWGWSTDSGSNTVEYSNQAKIEVVGNITLYAVWLKTGASTKFASSDVRDVKLGVGESHTDTVNTGFNKAELIEHGFRQIEINVTFAAKRENPLQLNNAEFWVKTDSYQKMIDWWDTDDSNCGLKWTDNEHTFTINTSDLNDNGTFYLMWNHYWDNGSIVEAWYLGETTVTCTAKK